MVHFMDMSVEDRQMKDPVAVVKQSLSSDGAKHQADDNFPNRGKMSLESVDRRLSCQPRKQFQLQEVESCREKLVLYKGRNALPDETNGRLFGERL